MEVIILAGGLGTRLRSTIGNILNHLKNTYLNIL